MRALAHGRGRDCAHSCAYDVAPTRPEASVCQSACDHSESAYAVLLLILSHCWVVAVGGLCVCLFAAVWVEYLCRCRLRRHRHVPKAILKASRLKTVVKEAKQRKEENVRLHHSRWSAHGCPHTRMQNTAHAHADRGCPGSVTGWQCGLWRSARAHALVPQVRKHSKPGSVKYEAERKKGVVRVLD